MNEELIELYKKTSKHSNYQVLPSSLKNIIDESIVPSISRYENERMDFLKKQLSFQNKKVLDVGGNTGFFSFEAIEAGAKQATLIEGNLAHETFVKKAAQIINKNITTNNYYLDFKTNKIEESYDIVLLFNVIHHLGDDFGDKAITMDEAKIEMQNAINFFSDKTELLVLQMGFCWKGDKNLLLFENGTKLEMIKFVKHSIKDKWEIQTIGVAEEIDEKTIYSILDDENVERYDSLGEFRNRPIFILKSI
jgi:2-polyprenyl-3-methyl-5-hydroxy-6-metoxy-1,4-benzoquinol methylase